jgi:hypothetical protein
MLPYIYILYEIRGIQKLFDGKGKQNASRLGHFFTVGWAVYPIAFTCPTLRNIYCTPSRISSTRRFIRSPKINLSLNAGVAVESNHVGRTYNLCKYATLGQDTRRALELTDSTRPSTEYSLLSLLRNDKNMYKSDLYTERIMAATFGRLLRSVGFLYLCWSVKLSVKQNGSWGTCKIIDWKRSWNTCP